MVTLRIEMNEETGQITSQIPNNIPLALGLIEYLRETVMVRLVRQNLESRIVTPPPMLKIGES
jgi:hypothetical protein